MKTIWPDYKNCISNLPNSIMKKFGITPAGDTLPLLDSYLEKDYRNIIVILLDGMGVSILEKNLEDDGFFRTHHAGSISSVFPPTTVAATTSVLSGLQPCEHSWLGWDCYYPQVDKNITVFFNVEQGTDRQAADYNVPYRYTGYESVYDRFVKAGRKAHVVAPFLDPHPDSFEKICDRIADICRDDKDEKYIYAYWDDPDTTMHMNGCTSIAARQVIAVLQDKVQALCSELTDSLVIVTADHGHINSRGVCITDYPTIMDCLVRLPSIEPRALNLFVKKGKEKQFEEEFTLLFGKDFILMTKEEVIAKQLFGTGSEHSCFRSMLGDYLAIAVGDLTIFNTKEEAEKFISVHAGLTEDEMLVPLIVIEC